MLINRLNKNYKKLTPQLKALNINAYRLYDKDLPEYPYQVDIYNEYGVCFEKGNPQEAIVERQSRAQEDFERILLAPPFNLRRLIFKCRKQKGQEGQYEKLSQQGITTVVKEGPALFMVNISDYLDVGLFLDHRPARSWIYRDLGPEKSFLNLFSYTCSASVFAALKGAHVTSVDLSKTYLDWGKKNFSLNGIKPERHQFVQQSALDFIGDENEHSKFDYIFLDPPTFSNSKRMQQDFEVERDQLQLVQMAMNCLKSEGTLLFSTNKRTFKLDEKLKEQFQISDLSKKSIPFDFRDLKIHQCYLIKK